MIAMNKSFKLEAVMLSDYKQYTQEDTLGKLELAAKVKNR